jgi:soluble lytic murein transglycosylase
MKNPQMRMLILLAVFWVAGSLLLAAESPSTPQPAATAKTTQSGAKTDATKTDATKTDAAKPGAAKTDAAKTDAAKTAAAKTDAKDASKDGDKDSTTGKPSIAEQAEAALKAAYEADPKVPAKGDPDAEQHAKDDTQAPPTGKGPSPQRFVPTEQVRADFDVSFPIDI